jgi:hypothetical protein
MCHSLNLFTSTVVTSPLSLLHTPLSTSSGSIRFWLFLFVLLTSLFISSSYYSSSLFHLYLSFPLPISLLLMSFDGFLYDKWSLIQRVVIYVRC